MTLSFTHSFVSTVADDPNAASLGEVLPSHWNAQHALTMATGNLLGRSQAGTGAVQEISIGSGLTLSGGVLSASAGSSGITVATTTVTGGSTGRVLYDNAGVVGEYLISGSGNVAMTNSPSLVTPALDTPSAGILTNCTGLPITTGVSGLGAGVATFLGTPSAANLISAVTGDTPAFLGRAQTFSANQNLGSAVTLGWNSDTILARDAANTLAQRNGVNTQTLRLYNTYTDASNYERLALQFGAGNAFYVTSEAAGTGTIRDVRLWNGNSTGVVAGGSTVSIYSGNAQIIVMNASGLLLQSGSLGYSNAGWGEGGAITQLTSRSTGVTLNTQSGAITLVSAAGSTTPTTFTVTDSQVAAADVIIVNQKSGTDKYEIFVTRVAAGAFDLTFFTTGGTTTEQPVFNFALIKGANS